jgi:hypothetical protein
MTAPSVSWVDATLTSLDLLAEHDGRVLHTLVLAGNRRACVVLPVDVTAADVARMARWLATLPLEDGELPPVPQEPPQATGPARSAR